MRWRSAVLPWLLALACMPAAAVEEQELKAAIVFNLLLFVEWPADVLPPGATSLGLCVGRASPLQPALKALEGRIVRSLRLDVRELPASGTPCHAAVLDDAAAVPTRIAPGLLLIADGDAAPAAVAAVVLHRAGTRVVFDVNLGVARQARLQLSSKLLRLARTVTE